jgi:hypothetical protein
MRHDTEPRSGNPPVAASSGVTHRKESRRFGKCQGPFAKHIGKKQKETTAYKRGGVAGQTVKFADMLAVPGKTSKVFLAPADR